MLSVYSLIVHYAICIFIDCTIGEPGRPNLHYIMSFLWSFYKWVKRANTILLDKMIPGQIPLFLGSPYYQLATIIEKWGPLRTLGNISPVRLTEYFKGLDKDILIM